jgi:shikimate dehydrogenase
VISGASRVAAVLGWPVEHSRSPAMMNAAFAAAQIDAVMVPFAVPPDRFEACVRGLAAGGALGASVTVPHKEAAFAICDEHVDRIGVVNCLVFRDGKIIGHNTDAPGFLDALPVMPKRAVLLGAGGAARAVAAGLGTAGAHVDVIARRAPAWIAARSWSTAELASLFPGCDLLVDCTPTALDPRSEAPLVDALPLDALPGNALVASLVYHRRPLLLDRAAARGLATLDGRGMLAHQGARAFTIWTQRPAPIDAMLAALA